MKEKTVNDDAAASKWWVKEADVIIAGGGHAGITAAVRASELGANVILLEKERDTLRPVGRDGRGFIGMFAVESSLQKKAGINLSKDWAFKYAVEYAHWNCNAPLVRRIIDDSADLVDWLIQHGVVFNGIERLLPVFPPVSHWFNNQSLEVIRTLTKRAIEKRVKLMYQSPATELIINPDGYVIGIKAMVKGQLMKIKGNAVILATGGMAHPDPVHRTPQPVTEDGIHMARCAGASIDYKEQFTYGFGTRRFLPRELDELARIMEQPLLFVNKSGERVFDEGLNYQSEMLYVAAYQKDCTLIEIFDESTKDNLINFGVKYPQHGTKFQKLTRLDEQIEEGIKQGFIEKASTISELSSKIKVDSATLEETIAQYNRFCDKKHDDMFLKKPEYLEPVRKPPFFAIICDQSFAFCMGRDGGVRINTKCQALDCNNCIISGLYVAGKDASGMYGNTYPFYLSGINMTFEIGTGRIAGENAFKFASGGLRRTVPPE